MHHVSPGGDSCRHTSPLALGLLGAATLCLLAAGGLMWWRHGPAVFADMMQAGIAWCF